MFKGLEGANKRSIPNPQNADGNGSVFTRIRSALGRRDSADFHLRGVNYAVLVTIETTMLIGARQMPNTGEVTDKKKLDMLNPRAILEQLKAECRLPQFSEFADRRGGKNTMFRMILALMILLGASTYVQGARQEPSNPDPSPAAAQRALLNRYCVTCHNDKLKTAGLMLDKMDLEHVSTGAEVWEKVIRKLRTGAMPPVGMPRPDKATYDSLATYLETAIDRAAAAKPNAGRPSVHRLNRTEYTHAIHDLLALDIDAESLLPGDYTGDGFDNNGDVLTVSPMLLERYMSAARQISRLAVGDPTMPVAIKTYDGPKLTLQDARMSEALPFGSRGGIAISHTFPLDGEYVVKIRLQRNTRGGAIIGLGSPHQLDVRLDGARIKLFTVGGKVGTEGSQEDVIPEETAVHDQDALQNRMEAALEVRFQAKAGTHLVGVVFVNENFLPEGMQKPPYAQLAFYDEGVTKGDPGVESVLIGGPYDAKGSGETASRRKLFVCHPTGAKDEDACAKKILSNLARHAYRRPVTEADIQPLLSFYKDGRSKGTFEEGIELALRRLLVDPQFLFRMERDPANVAPRTAYRITDVELASRLSFFLWSGLPDDQLLDLAARGKLRDSEVLKQQVGRMLRDPRSKNMVDNFSGQWLGVRSLRTMLPDEEAFPDFDENLRNAFDKEMEFFFESMVLEDHSVLELLNANYTFVNERLARHYGIPNIYGSRFRRVTLTDETRWGLLGKGSILTVTSYPNRTSPVLRGKWVLENILGTPPAPPPPNVPALQENKDTARLSMRQRMEQHRANPACAVCHARMDPVGFALDNFDAIAKWRTTETEAKVPIDASGSLPDGTKFQGGAELSKVLLQHPSEFVTTVTEKLLTYALGRGVEYYDQPAVREIQRGAASSNYRWSTLILGIVQSTPFQMRTSAERTTTAGLR